MSETHRGDHSNSVFRITATTSSNNVVIYAKNGGEGQSFYRVMSSDDPSSGDSESEFPFDDHVQPNETTYYLKWAKQGEKAQDTEASKLLPPGKFHCEVNGEPLQIVSATVRKNGEFEVNPPEAVCYMDMNEAVAQHDKEPTHRPKEER